MNLESWAERVSEVTHPEPPYTAGNASASNILVEIRLWIMDISHISQYMNISIYNII